MDIQVKIVSVIRLGTAALLLSSAFAGQPRPGDVREATGLRATQPVGFAVVQLRPSGATLSIMGLVECQEMEGLHQVAQGLHARIMTAQGELVRDFPRHFSFRVTATLRKTLIDGPDRTLKTGEEPQNLLLKLRFKLRIYDGLETEEIAPSSVTLIGVPADVNYNERIFRITFDVGSIPVTDRMILQVLSPEGEELTHFPFGLL